MSMPFYMSPEQTMRDKGDYARKGVARSRSSVALQASSRSMLTEVDVPNPDGVLRPGIVHRLDKDTSGVMVVARTPFSRTALSRQFKDRTVAKTYLAIVKGKVARDRVTIERPVGRHPVERKRMSVRSNAPRDAVRALQVAGEDGCGEPVLDVIG